eukprot:m.100438 g.100438  ORF g.100438 m.100438 type:complete len:110 (+) comp13707_c1_seq1:121-450(+)
MKRASKVRYRKVKDDNDWIPQQFEKAPVKVPYKAIAYAIVLFVVGTLLLCFGSFLYTGYKMKQDQERGLPMIILGALAFIPGSYHTYMAVQAWYEVPGWSYDDIPSSFD